MSQPVTLQDIARRVGPLTIHQSEVQSRSTYISNSTILFHVCYDKTLVDSVDSLQSGDAFISFERPRIDSSWIETLTLCDGTKSWYVNGKIYPHALNGKSWSETTWTVNELHIIRKYVLSLTISSSKIDGLYKPKLLEIGKVWALEEQKTEIVIRGSLVDAILEDGEILEENGCKARVKTPMKRLMYIAMQSSKYM